MILIDTGPLVGLIDPRDERHVVARADLPNLAGQPMGVTVPALTEVHFFLRPAIARRKLRAMLDELNATILDAPASVIHQAMDWMQTYANHEPDFADAVTVVLSGEIKGAKVWTYDREFRTIWRR